MIAKIKRVYNEINDKYVNEGLLNDKKFRERLKKDLLSMLGTEIIVRCDEANNNPSIVDMNIAVVDLRWNENHCYHNCTLAFGREDQIINTHEHLDAIQKEIISKEWAGVSFGLSEKNWNAN
jgi:hypothetical protein